jgi:hypothetical protein
MVLPQAARRNRARQGFGNLLGRGIALNIRHYRINTQGGPAVMRLWS